MKHAALLIGLLLAGCGPQGYQEPVSSDRWRDMSPCEYVPARLRGMDVQYPTNTPCRP